MVTLGLDASTTCVGYAFTEDKKILDMGFIDIKKEIHQEKKYLKFLIFSIKVRILIKSLQFMLKIVYQVLLVEGLHNKLLSN